MGRPRARVTLLDATRHSRPYTPDVAGIDGGGSDAGRVVEDDEDEDARGVYVFHSPVMDPIASANSSAVNRRTSGPANTYPRVAGSPGLATAGMEYARDVRMVAISRLTSYP
jgi:hypothetical protein